MTSNKNIIIVILLLILLLQIFSKYNDITEYFSPIKVDPSNRQILILYTGGTIGMKETKTGNKPAKGFLEKKINNLLNNTDKKYISNFHIKEYNPLLDSSNMDFKDWNKILHDIYSNYNDYDAFIVVHGTDTLSYTASALSFGLENLSKTVVVTGSQIPMQKIKNDGGLNMISSLIVASNYNIPEVMVVFDNNIFRGNRSQKINSTSLNAFDSPHMEPIGGFGYQELPIWNIPVLKQQSIGPLSIQYYNENIQVYNMFLTPGMGFNDVKIIVQANDKIKGIIIRTYGIGDAPVDNDKFIDVLKFLNEKDIPIMQVSQTNSGHIDTGDYDTGSKLLKYKVVSSKDMTIEAAYTKFLYLLNKYNNTNNFYNDTKSVRKNLSKELRGELNNSVTFYEVN